MLMFWALMALAVVAAAVVAFEVHFAVSFHSLYTIYTYLLSIFLFTYASPVLGAQC